MTDDCEVTSPYLARQVMRRWLAKVRRLFSGVRRRTPISGAVRGELDAIDEPDSEVRYDHFLYELPYLMGERFCIAQGYGGTYSHSGDAFDSIDFRMPEGTPICAARGGIVYHVV